MPVDYSRLRSLTAQSVLIPPFTVDASNSPPTSEGQGIPFLSLEDETGIANVILLPGLFEAYRAVLVNEPFLKVDGTLQNQDKVDLR